MPNSTDHGNVQREVDSCLTRNFKYSEDCKVDRNQESATFRQPKPFLLVAFIDVQNSRILVLPILVLNACERIAA
jgi:hypothetical protein